MAKLTKRERSVAAKYRRYRKVLERAQFFYELADRLAVAIADKLKKQHGTEVRISETGQGIRLVDNYIAAQKHPKLMPGQMPKAWAHGSVRQFELEEVKAVKGVEA